MIERTEKQRLIESIELIKDDLMVCDDLDRATFLIDVIEDAERELDEL